MFEEVPFPQRPSLTFNANAEGDVTGIPEAEFSFDTESGQWYCLRPTQDPELDGHTFVGWSTDAEEYEPFFDEEGAYLSEDTQLYAMWINADSRPIILIGESYAFKGHNNQAYIRSGNSTINFNTNTSKTLESVVKQANGTYKVTFKGSQRTYEAYVSTEASEGTPYGVRIESGNGSRANPYVLDILFKYTVKFVNDGEESTVTVNSGDLVGKPKVSKEGHSLDGWYTEMECENKYSFSNPVLSNLTLYANWITDKYPVTFYLDEEKTSVYVQEKYEYGTKAEEIRPEDPSKEADEDYGYVFEGWTPELEDVTKEAEYVAVFKKIAKPTVTLHENGEDVTGMPGVVYSFDSEVEKWSCSLDSEDGPAREGYDFAGWSTDPEDYEPIFEYSSSAYITENTDVYALWDYIDTRTVIEINDSYRFSRPVTHFSGGDTVPIGRKTLSSITKQSDGTYKARFSGLLSYDVTVTSDAPEGKPYGVRIVSGNGSRNNPYVLEVLFKYTVNFVDDEDHLLISYEYEGGTKKRYIGVPNAPEKTGEDYSYTFAGWDPALEDVSRNITYKATYTKTEKQFDVTFDANAGDDEVKWMPAYANIITIDGVDYFLEPDRTPVREGFVFEGWTRTRDSYEDFFFDRYVDYVGFASHDPADQDLTAYALWTPLSDYIDITFVTQTEDSSEYVSTIRWTDSLTFGVFEEVAKGISQPGYNFLGWYTEKEGGDPINKDTKITKEDHILYGHWERNYEILNVSFVNDGTTIKTIKVENGAVITDKPADQKKTGYDFLGWTAQGEEELFDFDTKVTSDLVLNATYKIIDYTIEYDLDGGEFKEEEKTSYTVEEEFTLPIPEKEGYSFLGWTGREIQNPRKNVTIRKGSTGDRTYTANWRAENVGYKVKKYIQNIDNDEYTLLETVNKTGRTGSSVEYGWISIVADEIAYHATINKDKSELKGTVKADGTTELSVYYDRNTYRLRIRTDKGIEKVTVNGESVQESDIYYRYGKKVSVVATLKPGYKAERGTSLQREFTMNNNHTANFETDIITYTISFLNEEGEKAWSDRRYTVETETFKLFTPEKEGYTFLGWTQILPEGDDSVHEEVIIEKGSTGNRTYKANFKANTYTVRFLKPVDLDGVEGEMEDQTFTYDQEAKLNENQYTKWGYEFIRWTDKEGNKYYNEQKVENLTAKDGEIVELTAVLEIAEYGVIGVVDFDDGESIDFPNIFVYTINDYADNKDIMIPFVAKKKGHTLTGWDLYTPNGFVEDVKTATNTMILRDDKGNRIADSLLAVAVFKANQYTLHFDISDAEDATIEKDSGPVTYGEKVGALYQPSSVKYHFDGWFTERFGQGDQYGAETVYEVEGDTTLYAKWILNASALDPVKDGDVYEVNTFVEQEIYNDLDADLILNTPTSSTIIPAGKTGSSYRQDPENYASAAADTHLHEVVNYPKDEQKHLIRLVVELLSDAEAKEVLLKEARERGFKDATETNSLLFEAHLLLDEEITELDGSIILTLRLPPAMCNVPGGYNREFRVLHRLSDGTIKEEQIVSLDLNNRIIKIKVDELSPFAVVFRNIAKPDDGRRSLPRTGVSSDDESHTMKMIALVAAFSLIGTMRIKAKAGKDYWENLK